MNARNISVGIIVIILAALIYFFLGTPAEAPVAVTEGGAPMGKQVASADNANGPIPGTWKSDEDPKFTREFTASGTITDRYEGDTSATITGSWTVVDPTTEATGLPVEAVTGMTIIKVTYPDSEVMYFGISSITETTLSLINLSGRGNILMFTKVM